MSKKNKEQQIVQINPFNEFNELYQNKYVKKMEYLIISYLDNIKSLSKYDRGLNNNMSDYEKDIANLIIEYNHSRGFHLSLNKRNLAEIWLSIREKSNNQIHFLTQITSTFISGLTIEEYNNLIEHIAFSYGCFTTNNEDIYKKANIINEIDNDYFKQLPNQRDLIELLKHNPWVLILILINQMDTILK